MNSSVRRSLGPGRYRLCPGQRVGIPWLGGSCGACFYCRSNRETLCDDPRFTGYHLDGGYAEYVCTRADFCLPLPPEGPPVETAPPLCAVCASALDGAAVLLP